MAATAKTKKDVQSQSSRDRLWDELENKYSQERVESDKAYDQNKAAFTRGLVNRGMQRSSYGGQMASGYDKEKINAQNKSHENQIAAYQSGVDAIEQREAEERYRQQQLALQQAQMEQAQKQFEAQLAFNKEQAALSQQNWQAQFDQSKSDTEWSRNFQQSQADLAQKNTEWSQGYQQQQADRSQNQWEQQFGYQQSRDAVADAFNNKQFEYQQQQDALAQKNTEWSQSFQQQQADLAQANTEWSQNYQQSRDAVSDAFNEKQFNAQQEQWREEFDYQQKSDSQKIAYNYVTSIIEAGGSPSDELLAQAGLSRADANAMTKQASSGGYSPSKRTTEDEDPGTSDDTLREELNRSNSTTGGMPLKEPEKLTSAIRAVAAKEEKNNPEKLALAKAAVNKEESDASKKEKQTSAAGLKKLLTDAEKEAEKKLKEQKKNKTNLIKPI